MLTKRLFFALWPDHRQREAIGDALSPSIGQVEGRAVSRGNWHVTLVFLGAFPEARTPALMRAVSDIPVNPFRLRFTTLSFWPGPRVAVLETQSVPPELTRLVELIRAAAEAFGIEPDERPYRPHITAARKVKPFEPIQLARPLGLSFASFELLESVSAGGVVSYRLVKQ